MKRKKNRFHWFLGLLGLMVIGIGSWALFSLLNQGASDVLKMFGIQNFYLQTLIVIVVVLVGLLLSGYSIWKAFERLAKG